MGYPIFNITDIDKNQHVMTKIGLNMLNRLSI